MKSIAFLLAAAIFIGAAVSAGIDLRTHYLLKDFQTAIERFEQNPPLEHETQALLQTSAAVASTARNNAEGGILRAYLYQLLAQRTTDPQGKIGHYCSGLSAVSQALGAEPYNAAYLLRWASIRQLLGSWGCSEPLTAGDYHGAVQLALQHDPRDTRILFAAAVIFGWGGERRESQDLLHQVLVYDTGLSRAKEQYVLGQIETPDDLQAIVPARFPQIARWSQLLAQNLPDLRRRLAPQLGLLQQEALTLSEQEFQKGEIPNDLRGRRLLSLLEYSASSEVAQRLDALLGDHYARIQQPEAAAYLQRRAEGTRLAAPRAVLPADTRPLHTPLVGWDKNEQVPFDHFHCTLGFYLPAAAELKLIELHGKDAYASAPTEFLRVYVSRDNQQWQDISADVEVRSLTVAGRSVIAITPHHSRYKYWKIHYDHSERRDTFINPLETMLQLYGNTTKDFEAPVQGGVGAAAPAGRRS